MQIRNIDLGTRPLLLAPMEDVTDAGFRLLCRRMGACMVYSEFVAADALIRGVNKSLDKLTVNEEERPVAIQIYGRDPDTMAEAARIVEATSHPDVIDLNFGCPVKRVAGKGAGAGMLRTPGTMLAITKTVVEAVPQTPVTVKTRLGWDKESIVIGTLAEQLQDCGIAALTIHGRTRSEMYSGTADWEPIGQVKANPRIRIPIIGNGDITTPTAAAEAFRHYGVDAVMVGRAAFGAPWVFREMSAACQPSPSYTPLTTDEKFGLLRDLIAANLQRIGELRGILHSRRHLAASPLFKGIANFRPLRIAILRATTADELFRLLGRARPLIPQP